MDRTAPSGETLRSTFYTQQQLCKELPGVTMRKLAYWRSLRIGPKWARIGREIIYLRESVAAWLRANEITIEREPTRKPRIKKNELTIEREPARSRRGQRRAG